MINSVLGCRFVGWINRTTITNRSHLLPSLNLSAWTIGLVSPPPPFFLLKTLPFITWGDMPISQSCPPIENPPFFSGSACTGVGSFTFYYWAPWFCCWLLAYNAANLFLFFISMPESIGEDIYKNKNKISYRSQQKYTLLKMNSNQLI